MNSFFSTAKGRRPSKFVGLENYDVLWNDATFWKVLTNNIIYACGPQRKRFNIINYLIDYIL